MTTQEIQKLSDDELRVKVAELCGFSGCKVRDVEGLRGKFIVEEVNLPVKKVPDYLRDLNAMHEAENILLKEQRLRFADLLDAILHHPDDLRPQFDNSYFDGAEYFGEGRGYEEVFNLAHATARQRAEAFVLTLDKS